MCDTEDTEQAGPSECHDDPLSLIEIKDESVFYYSDSDNELTNYTVMDDMFLQRDYIKAELEVFDDDQLKTEPMDEDDVDSDNGVSNALTEVAPEGMQSTPITTYDDAVWSAEPTEMAKFEFTGEPGLLVPVPEKNDPIDYFNLMATDEFYLLAVEGTNAYAVNLLLTKTKLTPNSRITDWKEVSRSELEKFVGILLHMGTIPLPKMDDYWKTDPLFSIPIFTKTMSRNRFLLIMSCLYFSKISPNVEQETKNNLNRILPLINVFNKTVSKTYYPQRELILDQSLVLYKGNIVFRNDIQCALTDKYHSMYMLKEPTGFVVKFNVCNNMENVLKYNLQKNLILRLAEEKLNRGHALYIHQSFCSYQLAYELLHQHTYCTGRLPSDSIQVPDDVKNAKLYGPSEIICRWSNGIVIGKWHNKENAAFVSTEFSDEIKQVKGKTFETKRKPLALVRYNEYMNSTDQEHVMTDYPCAKKSFKWYKKLGIHLIQLMLLNSFYLYNRYSGKRMTFYDFRLAVIKRLMKVDDVKANLLSGSRRGFEGLHVISKCTSNEKGRKLRKKCRQCSKLGKRTDTMFYCGKCPDAPGLCVTPCFEIFHTAKYFANT